MKLIENDTYLKTDSIKRQKLIKFMDILNS